MISKKIEGNPLSPEKIEKEKKVVEKEEANKEATTPKKKIELKSSLNIKRRYNKRLSSLALSRHRTKKLYFKNMAQNH